MLLVFIPQMAPHATQLAFFSSKHFPRSEIPKIQNPWIRSLFAIQRSQNSKIPFSGRLKSNFPKGKWYANKILGTENVYTRCLLYPLTSFGIHFRYPKLCVQIILLLTNFVHLICCRAPVTIFLYKNIYNIAQASKGQLQF